MASSPIRSPSLRDEPTWQTAAFILPLIVFLVISSFFVPDFTGSTGTDGAASAAAKGYLVVVGLQIAIAAGLLFYFRRIYTLHFPLKWSWLSVVVGVVGIVAWVVLSELKLERQLFTAIGLEGWLPNRSSFNPFAEFSDPGFRAIFLTLRFALLALMVPIVEELFIRGWLVRWIQDQDWQLVSLKQLGFKALAAATVYGVMTHPAEALAAIAWFSLVTWLMHRTGNLWDCVIAHAVTNFLLGVYVIYAEAWHLW
jgi:CAAX prenyl protease-like protein